jgi:thiamine biosynthesis lipoprotein
VAAITAIRSAPDLVRTSFTAFGTYGVLQVTRREELAAARRMLAAELQAIDATCSRFRPDSELTSVNARSGRKIELSPLLAEALAVALRAAAATDGDVDPTCGASLVRLGYDRDFAELAADSSPLARPPVPAGGWRSVDLDHSGLTVQVPPGVQLDLGATAKALAADRAATAIAAATEAGVLVDLGGDIAVAGPPPPSGWRVRIVDGLGSQGPVVAIRDGGLATSGTGDRRWRRGELRLHHILIPATGLPASSCWLTATVAAASCADANTASTAAIIRSATAPAWLTSLGLPARLAASDGRIVTTPGWPDELEP